MTDLIRRLRESLVERAWTRTALVLREPTSSLSTEVLELRPAGGGPGAPIVVMEDGGSLHVMAGSRSEWLLDDVGSVADLVAAVVEYGLVEDYLLCWLRDARPATDGEAARSGWRRRLVWPPH